MLWSITHCEYPDGDPERLRFNNIEDVWTGLEEMGVADFYDDDELTRLWEGTDPISWMKRYNEIMDIPGEFFLVWDLEEDKQLL